MENEKWDSKDWAIFILIGTLMIFAGVYGHSDPDSSGVSHVQAS